MLGKKKKICLQNQINTAKINYLFSLSSNISSKSEIDSKNNFLPSEYLTLHLQFMSACQKAISLLLLIKFFAILSNFSRDFVKSKYTDLPFRVLCFL